MTAAPDKNDGIGIFPNELTQEARSRDQKSRRHRCRSGLVNTKNQIWRDTSAFGRSLLATTVSYTHHQPESGGKFAPERFLHALRKSFDSSEGLAGAASRLHKQEHMGNNKTALTF